MVNKGQRHTLTSEAVAVVNGVSGMHAPVVVLTEGRTDVEFLSAALNILYPHLADLIRFLDYDQKAEGGAGALVRMVRAFAAAGIVNRVVAIFDNDTAAADALRALDLSKLPDQLRVLQYPAIGIASKYLRLAHRARSPLPGQFPWLMLTALQGVSKCIWEEMFLWQVVANCDLFNGSHT
jgi:hypothetical protein